MKTLALLLALISVPFLAHAQTSPVADGAVVESVEVTGLALDQLSPGLRQDIAALPGQPLSRERVNALARRIEEEHPDVVAAVRDVVRPDGRVRVVFLVARIAESEDLLENINARYVVEDVDVSGISESRISSQLRADLMGLEGSTLDPRELGDINQRLKDEFPDHSVSRRISRGNEPGQVKIVFDIRRSERSRWLHFEPSRTKLVFHQNQRWSGVFDLPLGGTRGDNHASLDLVRGNNDDLVEEYSGFGFRFQNRSAGTERVGLRLELSRYSQTWREATISALALNAEAPLLYRKRVTVAPAVMVALTRHVRLSAGLAASELTPLTSDVLSQRVNAFVASAGYGQDWRSNRFGRQTLDAHYEIRAGTESLDSDLAYRRNVGGARYRVGNNDRTFIADFRAGRITGRAPMFERFSLGDTSTLRGWNKFDLAPSGADNMWHQSVEFRYEGFAYFVDAGSLWNTGEDRKIRLATGIGFHHDSTFVTLGFPLNADKVNATFMVGVRLGVQF